MFIGIMLTCCVGCALSRPIRLSWLGMCFLRLPLLIFLANWVCYRHFSCSQDLLVGLSGILHLDTKTVPHVRR